MTKLAKKPMTPKQRLKRARERLLAAAEDIDQLEHDVAVLTDLKAQKEKDAKLVFAAQETGALAARIREALALLALWETRDQRHTWEDQTKEATLLIERVRAALRTPYPEQTAARLIAGTTIRRVADDTRPAGYGRS